MERRLRIDKTAHLDIVDQASGDALVSVQVFADEKDGSSLKSISLRLHEIAAILSVRKEVPISISEADHSGSLLEAVYVDGHPNTN